MADATAATHPFVEALPPATDYLTYLTLLEYNLKEDDLPLLNDLLQDATLTINIGWDLVFLLIPMLPASEPCLQTIARLGNPREALLKVTEALRIIEFDPVEQDFEASADSKLTLIASNEAGSSAQALASDAGDPRRPSTAAGNSELPYLQFEVLLSMLATLHRRIKTKYPSRFIATTLQGVLAAFANVEREHERLIPAIHIFVKQLLSSGRPFLPPRESQEDVPTLTGATAGSDPEAQAEPASQEEHRMTRRLLQGFATHIMDTYMIALSNSDEVPGLSWSVRALERMQPEKIVPGRTSMEIRFAEEGGLSRRESSVKAMMSLAIEIGLGSKDLLRGALETDRSSSNAAGAEEDPPESAEDIPLSQGGSLFLLAARSLGSALDKSKKSDILDIELFPTQLQLAKAFIGTDDAGGLNTAGTEPSALIDTILGLGLTALAEDNIGEPETDESFSQYLQMITLISANSFMPALRFNAHFLATSVLRTHPSDVFRLSFIRDTLEHCPIENLKASAVGWIKGEVVEANLSSNISDEGKNESVFTTPVCLETLGPFLFPDLSQAFGSDDVEENWTTLKLNMSFYLAVLNFYFLLLSAPALCQPLKIASLHTDNDIGGSMLGPLRQKSAEFRESLMSGVLAQIEGEEGVQSALADLELLDYTLTRVESGVIALNNA